MSEKRKEQAERIAEDHSLIRTQLSELATSASADLVHRRLTALLPVLREHFALEEDLAQYEAQNPAGRMSGRVKVLEEHPQILSKAEALIVASAGDAAVAEMVGEFVAFVKSHEARETEALMDAIWTDIGGS